jgi:hypothetical protein
MQNSEVIRLTKNQSQNPKLQRWNQPRSTPTLSNEQIISKSASKTNDMRPQTLGPFLVFIQKT